MFSSRSSSSFPFVDLDMWDTKSCFSAQSSAWCGMAAVSGSGFLSSVGNSGSFRPNDPGLRRWQSSSHLAAERTSRPFSPPGAELRGARGESSFRQAEVTQWLKDSHERVDTQLDRLKTRERELSYNMSSAQLLGMKHKQLEAIRTLEQLKEAAIFPQFEKSQQHGELREKVLTLEKDLFEMRSGLGGSSSGQSMEGGPGSHRKTSPEKQKVEAETHKLREALRQAEAKMKIVEEERNKALQHLQSATQTQKTLLSQIEELNQRHRHIVQNQSGVKQQLSDANNKFSQACLEKAVLSTQVLKLEDNVKEMKAKHSEVLSDKDRLTQEKADLLQRTQVLEEQLEKTQHHSEEHSQDTKTLNEVHQEIEKLREQLEMIGQRLEVSQNQLEELKEEKILQDRQITELKEEKILQSEQITELKEEKILQDRQITELKEEKILQDRQITELKEEKILQSEQITELKEEKILQSEQITELKEEKILQSEQITDREAERSHLIRGKEELLGKTIKAGNEGSSEYRDSVQRLEEENQTLQDQYARLQAEFSEREEMLRLLEEDHQKQDVQRVQTIEELRATTSHWTEKWQKVALTLQATQEELDRVKNSNSRKEREGDSLLRVEFDACKQALELERSRSQALLLGFKSKGGDALQAQDKHAQTHLSESSLLREPPSSCQNKSPQVPPDSEDDGHQQTDVSSADSLRIQLDESRREVDQLQQEKTQAVHKLQTLRQLFLGKDEKASVEEWRDKTASPVNLGAEQQRRMVTEQLKSLFKEREEKEAGRADKPTAASAGASSPHDWTPTPKTVRPAVDRRNWQLGSGLMPVFEEDEEEEDWSEEEEEEEEEEAEDSHAESSLLGQRKQMSAPPAQRNNLEAANQSPQPGLSFQPPLHSSLRLDECDLPLERSPALYPDGIFKAELVDICIPDEDKEAGEVK